MLAAGSSARAEPNETAVHAVPVARVDSTVVHLDVVEGKDIRFAHLTREQGLSQSRVTHIVQDDQGFLWFGTMYGLDRYDGYRFKVFKHERDNPSSLCGVEISSLYKDRSGALWVGCDYSLDRYDAATETFVHYQINPGRAQDNGDTVRHITQDHMGMLWLSTGRGLYRLDPHSGNIHRFHHENAESLSLSSDNVKSSGEDRQGVFWVATAAGLDAFDRGTGHVTLHVPLFEPQHELSFYEDQSGVFWVLYASGNGLAVFDRKENLLTRYSWSAVRGSATALTGVIQMLEDRNGNLWLGTLSDGILKFDRQHRRFISYRNDPSNPESLSENRITTLFEDREGSMWIGLGGTEPSFFDTRPSAFDRLPFDSHNAANLGETFVNAVYEDRTGVVWVGTTGALNRFDPETRQYAHYDIPGHGTASDVLSIIEDRSGTLWVGTSGQGLCRFDRAVGCSRIFRHSETDSSSVAHDTVTRLFVDHRGTLWAGTWDGLSSFDPATERFTTYRVPPDKAATQYLSIAEDERGRFWIGSIRSGLLRFDPVTGQFSLSGIIQGRTATLDNERVNAVFIDHNGGIWAGTQNGLNRLDPVTGRIDSYSEKDGLSSNAVSCILEDAGGHLWISTSAGLSRLDPRDRSFKSYSVADGLPGHDLTGYSACYESASGKMIFGGISGAVEFRPEEVRDNPYTPSVALTAFDLFGVPVTPEEGSPLRRVIGHTRNLTLSHNQNSFAFEFSALSFRNPSTNRYRYMLEGLDHQWQEVGSDRRIASYTTLPSGAYRFRVQAATSRGPWSEPGLAIALTIMPAWWRTWWFYALCALISFGSLGVLYRVRTQQIRSQTRNLLEARLTERERIARELHDTLLQSLQGLMLYFKAAADRIPEREPARRLTERALERAREVLVESRDRVKELRASAEVADLTQTLAEVGQQFALASTAEFQITVEGKPCDLHPIAREEALLIGREAVANAFRHAEAHRIELEISYGQAELKLRIRDDGRGIDPEVLRAGGRPGRWGLLGMHERATKIRAHLDIWSKIGAGTEVELRVPAALAYGAAKPGLRTKWWRRLISGVAERRVNEVGL